MCFGGNGGLPGKVKIMDEKFSKDDAGAVKGVAILLMLMHHIESSLY